jgi:putative heme iron utilization protein
MNPDDARLLAALIRKERIAHLATLRDGVPMASMTLYLPAADFSAFYVHVSRLAWHTQDMQRDSHVALSIAETDDRRADPFRLMRVSIRGAASVFSDDDSEIKNAYLAKYPEQAINFTLADFAFWRIAPKDARFIAGFGRIHNVSAEELTHAAG